MAIPYQPTKFKSANIFAILILGPTTKFNISGYTVMHNLCNYFPNCTRIHVIAYN